MTMQLILEELARLDNRDDLAHLAHSTPLAPLIPALLSLPNAIEQCLVLTKGADLYPSATWLLILEIQKDQETLLALAPTFLRTIPCVERHQEIAGELDMALYKIHHRLPPQLRFWAEQRRDIRKALELPEQLKAPEPEIPEADWPPADSIEGIQIRLNAQDYPAGLITG